MTDGTCARLFEVEALRDGRLGGAERRSFERHLRACPVCAGEAQSLEKLAEAVRGDVQRGGGLDELHVWRERNRLLAALDGALVSSKWTSDVRRLLLWPSAVAAIVGAIAIFWHGRPAVEPLRRQRRFPACWGARPSGRRRRGRLGRAVEARHHATALARAPAFAPTAARFGPSAPGTPTARRSLSSAVCCGFTSSTHGEELASSSGSRMASWKTWAPPSQ